MNVDADHWIEMLGGWHHGLGTRLKVVSFQSSVFRIRISDLSRWLLRIVWIIGVAFRSAKVALIRGAKGDYGTVI